MKLLITELSGKGRELGMKFASLFPKHSKETFNEFYEALKDESTFKYVTSMCSRLEKIYPDYYAEICGRAEVFGISREAFILGICCQTFSPVKLSKHESCSDILAIGDRGALAGHNEDLAEDLNELALIKYTNEDGSWFCDMSTCNCPQGTTFGWNSHGITYSVNAIATDDNDPLGVPEWFILRDIISCSSVEEIYSRVENQRCTGAFSLNITDSFGGAYNIEHCFTETSIKRVSDFYCHTNHLIHPDISYRNRELSPSTALRLNICEKLMAEQDPKSADDIEAILLRNKGKEDYVRRIIGTEKYPTCATYIVDRAQNSVKIISHYDGNTYKFSIS